jgi:hypothetical protein
MTKFDEATFTQNVRFYESVLRKNVVLTILNSMI